MDSLFCIFLGALLTLSVVCLFKGGDKPSAMDVYRGYTTLKITYVDGVPVDSVVVYKESYEH